MLKHLLPAWLPLLLLITFLGCQSFETKKPTVSIEVNKNALVNACPKKTKKIYANTELTVCGHVLLNTSKYMIIKNLSLLQKMDKRQYKLAFTAKDFQLFKWSRFKKSQLHEVMPIFLNKRYKILNIASYRLNCDQLNCTSSIDNCETKSSENLFPLVSYRIKYNLFLKNTVGVQVETQKTILQQLVWQAVNGDIRAKSILINYNDWLTVKPHMIARFNHFKKIVENKSNNMCIKKHNLFVNNY